MRKVMDVWKGRTRKEDTPGNESTRRTVYGSGILLCLEPWVLVGGTGAFWQNE